jgi:hypothetical protein
MNETKKPKKVKQTLLEFTETAAELINNNEHVEEIIIVTDVTTVRIAKPKK